MWQNKEQFQKDAILYLTNAVVPGEQTFKEKVKLDRKKLRELKLNEIIHNMETALKALARADVTLKELTHKTEFWEEKEIFNFNIAAWGELQKIKGQFIRYYNRLCIVKQAIKKEKKELWQ